MAYSRRSVLFGAVGTTLGAAPATAPAAGAARRGAPPVVVTDQASKRILVLDARRSVWGAADPLWAFSPLGDGGYADLRPDVSWVYPSEAKVRRHRGRTLLLTCASFGFAAAVEFPTGRRYWGAGLGPGDDLFNPHSMEILPDGNVAVACSTGALVRLYAASQGQREVPYADAVLKGAHGLHRDRGRRVLWAIGDDELVTYEVGGTPARPALTQTSAVRLPGARPGGHDLFPVAGRHGRLWVTTNAAVFQYDIGRGEFVQDFPGAGRISRTKVKAVGDDPRTGQVVSTVPEVGLEETWWTTRVDFHRPDETRVLTNGGIYKARWWLPR
ncbi:hypothetical protein H9Y04_30310 [Streptomyces sp. TRM66268-LWL]|uniref:PQQ-binding-like beta-propeller repeat protein n=1 Tax=Streptomyces polyasparticus TaxID=2767826 RepID=A0ABR7SMX2_9ACTN|nr:DUF6528 family protein [Streptomyces polyasparticus]MBC9716836.1 hypothetical protein [Streptomyces polyasparticus]